MLHDFILSNRERIIDRARERARERIAPQSVEAELEHGIPFFLTQLAGARVPADAPGAPHLSGAHVRKPKARAM